MMVLNGLSDLFQFCCAVLLCSLPKREDSRRTSQEK